MFEECVCTRTDQRPTNAAMPDVFSYFFSGLGNVPMFREPEFTTDEIPHTFLLHPIFASPGDPSRYQSWMISCLAQRYPVILL